MKKKWFILEGETNSGPFSSLELIEFSGSGRVKPFTLCWKKGMSKWRPYFDLVADLKKSLEAGLPALPGASVLPPLPKERALPAIPAQKVPKVTKPLETVKVPESILEDEPLAIVLESSEEFPTLSKFPDNDDFDQRVFPIASSLFGAVSVFVVLIISFFIFYSPVQKELIFKNVSLDVLKSLQTVKKGEKFYVSLGLDKSGEIVFGKLNLAPELEVQARFNLINDKTHTDEVSFISSSIARGGNLKFDDFSFVRGNKIIQGKYKVLVNAKVQDPFELLKSFFTGATTSYSYEDVVYLIPGSKKAYNQRLKKIKYNKISKVKDLLTSLDQKVQTIDSIIISIALQYRISLNRRNGTLSSQDFESRYVKSAGPLLQNIILSDFKKLDKKAKQDINIQVLEEHIHQISKRVAAWSVELTEKLARYGPLNKRKRKKLKSYMGKKRDLMQADVNKIRGLIKVRMHKIRI